ncbi:MAG: DUF882 domain-containing protein [Myxococcota bacterium]
MTRRRRASLVVLLACVPAQAASRGARVDRYPTVTVSHTGFGKSIAFKLYDAQGHAVRKEVRRLEELLRCHHTGRRHALDHRLVALLYRVARHYPGQRIEVVSGYRHPRIARQKGTRRSFHTRGRAADIRVPGVANETLRDYLRMVDHVGVGYYPNSTFVHVDVRDDRSAYWIDRSGPGARPDYIAEEDLGEEQVAGASSDSSAPAAR